MKVSVLAYVLAVAAVSGISNACARGFIPGPGLATNSTPNSSALSQYDLSVSSPDYPKAQVISVLVNMLLEASIDSGALGGDTFFCPSMTESSLVPDPFDCSSYYKCEGGRSTRVNCEANMGFDNGTQKCVPAESVKLCQDLPFDPNYKCEFNGLHVYPASCEKYAICVNGKGYVAECAIGKLFDSALRLCVPKDQALCVPRAWMNSI